MYKFEIGKTYAYQGLYPKSKNAKIHIINRTEKTITAEVNGYTKTFRIKLAHDIEYIEPTERNRKFIPNRINAKGIVYGK